MKLKPLKEQVVVLIGASSGIGRETALRFAKQGAKLVVASRSQPALNSLVEEIRSMGGTATAITCDVAEFEQVQAVANKAVSEYGRIDSWVHLAGVGMYGRFEDTRPEEFRRVIEVNLLGAAHGAMVAIPKLKANNGGSLVIISSIEGKRALPLQAAYTSSKHGVEGFVEAMRLELKKDGVPINVVNVMPASINTPLFAQSKTRLGVKPMPIPPVYEPEVVAGVIEYAATHEARDLIAGGVGKLFLLGQAISPALADVYLKIFGFRFQQTTEKKASEDSNNLFEPVESEQRIRGEFGLIATPRSYLSWLDTHPLAKRIAQAAIALSLVSTLSGRGKK